MGFTPPPPGERRAWQPLPQVGIAPQDWHWPAEDPVEVRAARVLDLNPHADPRAWPDPDMRAALVAERQRRGLAWEPDPAVDLLLRPASRRVIAKERQRTAARARRDLNRNRTFSLDPQWGPPLPDEEPPF